MNDFDKNFHINFSPLYFAFAFMVFMLWASEVKGDDKEPIGHTEHGIPVYAEEISEESQAQLSIDRALKIDIKGIKKVKTNVLNVNTLEMTVDNKVYTMIVDCKLTEIDNFQWQTRGDGSLDVGDFGFARRNPFKYFDNPALELSKEQVEAKLEDWDLDTRTCKILALQLAGTIEEEENGEEK